MLTLLKSLRQFRSDPASLLHITQEGFAFSHCTECRAAFLLRANVPPDRWWLRLKFQLLVARDHTLIFFVVQLVRCSHLLLSSSMDCFSSMILTLVCASFLFLFSLDMLLYMLMIFCDIIIHTQLHEIYVIQFVYRMLLRRSTCADKRKIVLA